jgi:hypothetical protein
VAFCILCAGAGSQARDDGKHLTSEVRREAIRRAQVWQPTDIPATDVIAGPQGEGAFELDQTLGCTFVKRQASGHTPKFFCMLNPNEEIKVKYGRDNGEVFAEVAATRLFWALGFGADRMYSVRVICRGCPFDSLGQSRRRVSEADEVFDPAAVERKMPGRTMETHADSGWVWSELDIVDESAGGAPRAHRDALKLLAALVQHSDSKAEQQRLICLPGAEDEKGTCRTPFMFVSDLGQTFGRANLFNQDSVGGVNLKKWASTPVWKQPELCVANLSKSITGTLEHPRISEEGRQFLASLLTQLSDQQIHDVFDAAQISLRSGDPRRSGTIEEWVTAFTQKRDEIVHRTCPS